MSASVNCLNVTRDVCMYVGHWLVRMEWLPAGWSVCLPLLIFLCTIKSKSSLLAPSHPGGPGKRAIKRLWWVVCVYVCFCVYVYVYMYACMCVCSSRGSDAHWSVHSAAVEWRTQLWRPSQQAVLSPSPDGHSRLHRISCRLSHHCLFSSFLLR